LEKVDLLKSPEFIAVEDIGCPLGCIKNDKPILTGRDLLHDLPGEFTVVKCRTCGLMRTNPRPTVETIGFYYPDDYGPYLGTRVQQTNPKRMFDIKRSLGPWIKSFFHSNTTILPLLPPGRMLEIGCASGAFLHEMACKGWQVQGIEFSNKAAQAATRLGYHVHVGSIEAAPSPDEGFDLIVGWMTLEHLHDPIRSLNKLRDWAKPGAYLAISVPNAAALEFRLFKDAWYALQLPTHLYHYTPQSLEKILLAGGWKIQHVFHQRNINNLIASIGYVLRANNFSYLGKKLIAFPEKNGWLVFAIHPIAWIFSLIGQTGRITIWSRVK
jgi:2-polyprenyl-3-methyl-5-hydroxy-6-metoxy-1,4-benzoquinol methylase